MLCSQASEQSGWRGLCYLISVENSVEEKGGQTWIFLRLMGTVLSLSSFNFLRVDRFGYHNHRCLAFNFNLSVSVSVFACRSSVPEPFQSRLPIPTYDTGRGAPATVVDHMAHGSITTSTSRNRHALAQLIRGIQPPGTFKHPKGWNN